MDQNTQSMQAQSVLTQNVVEQIKSVLVKKLEPSFIILFGSQATGATHSESDVDLAFYKPECDMSVYDVFSLASELASLVKADVDLINLSEASTVFKAQIFATGKPLYIANQFEFDKYQMNVMSMYANLNVERREILKSIIERGRIYDN